MTVPYTCRWGILGCGGIASCFTKDLVIDPKTRDVGDVVHVVQAAATSNSAERARKFLEDCGVSAASSTVYGSYQELAADPNVDIIYIATPHSHHFKHTLLCLNAGKNVVCEKPFTVNAAQLKILTKVAKEKNLFLMEAVWTRFFPLSIAVRELVKSGRIGQVKRVTADLCFGKDPATHFDDSHRMVNPDLAGGALLDLGVYSLNWVYQILYHTLSEEERKKATPSVSGSLLMYHTGVDIDNVVVCSFPSSVGIATSGLSIHTDPNETGEPAVKIQGTNGEIRVRHPAYCPTKMEVVGRGKEKAEAREFPLPPGEGMHWEADAAARCVRDGKLECETMPLVESILIMEAMDRVRECNGMKYPEHIESVEQ